MAVDDDGLHQRAAVIEARRLEPGDALVRRPAVVRQPADERPRPVVDLLPLVLADVADVEVTRRAIEAEPPRVAEAVSSDAPAAADVAEELAEPPGEVL